MHLDILNKAPGLRYIASGAGPLAWTTGASACRAIGGNMHFLIGLGILAGLVWLAFGAGAARALVGVALLAVAAFFGFIFFVAAVDIHRQSVEQSEHQALAKAASPQPSGIQWQPTKRKEDVYPVTEPLKRWCAGNAVINGQTYEECLVGPAHQ
jgi:hypothetical protein